MSPSTPRTMEHLEITLMRLGFMTETRVHDLLVVLDRYGLAIVPKEPTESMTSAAYNAPMAMRDTIRAAVAASPFRQETAE